MNNSAKYITRILRYNTTLFRQKAALRFKLVYNLTLPKISDEGANRALGGSVLVDVYHRIRQFGLSSVFYTIKKYKLRNLYFLLFFHFLFVLYFFLFLKVFSSKRSFLLIFHRFVYIINPHISRNKL